MSDIDVEAVDEVEDDESDEGGGDHGDDGHDHGGVAVDVEGDAPETTTADDVALDGIDAPEYVLYGGKGGVGKTTMAAATGLASAADGTNTLVVSTDPAHSLSDTFETEIPPTPTRIRDEIPLYAAEIDPETAVDDSAFAGMAADGEDPDDPQDPFGGAGGTGAQGAGGAGAGPFGGGEDGPMGGMGELLGGGEGGPMGGMMGGAVPGADEAAAMQTLLEYMDDPRFDRVVVDTAPTGHTLRLLELPEVMDSMVGRMLTMRERLSGMMDGLKGMFGGDTPEQQGGMEDLEELADRIERLRATLRDPTQTDFRVVVIPEEMSVFESKRLLAQLREFEIPVSTVVVNKVMESLGDVTADVDASDFVSPNLADCAFCQHRWDVQQSALAEAQEIFRDHGIRRVPLFADEVRGERMLRVVAACLD